MRSWNYILFSYYQYVFVIKQYFRFAMEWMSNYMIVEIKNQTPIGIGFVKIINKINGYQKDKDEA